MPGETGAAPRRAQRRRQRTTFRERLRQGDTYGLLLAVILSSFALLAVLEENRWSRIGMSMVYGLMLLLALHTSHIRGRLWSAGLVLAVGVALVSSFASAISAGRDNAGAVSYLMFILMSVAPVVILVHIARHPVVNMETILGALCAYLLVGVIFSGLYRGMDIIYQGGFFQQTNDASPVEFLYFSFMTLCTVGYGDFTAAHDTGRILVIFEALTGQFFLVTIVAGLVGSFGRERRRLDPPPRHTAHDYEDAEKADN